jgi:flavin-dependent dehydrogenase
VLIEKAKFPRFHIGESLTGECGNCLRALGLEEEMLARRYPIKQGVTVYGPNGKNNFFVPVKAYKPETGLMDAITWSMRRSEFDRMLLEQALGHNVTLLDGEAVEPIRAADGAVGGVRMRTAAGRVEDVEADVVVDASGASTFLCSHGVTGPKSRGSYDKQVALFSQVTGAIRDPLPEGGNTLIFYQKQHHWAWFIPLDDEVTSVGVVVPTEYYKSCGESKEAFLKRELRELNSELSRRLPTITLTDETRGISNYSYHIKEFTGRGYLCVGDSHRFIDPVFSFGVYFSMKEAEFAAKAIADHLKGGPGDGGNPFLAFQQLAERGQDNIQNMLDAFWEQPYAFAIFAHHRYREDIIHMFAGRIYDDTPTPGQEAMRRISEHARLKAAM